jgi:hypothetical protein
MAYPRGPYPVPPPQPRTGSLHGTPPPSVQRAFVFMLVAAAVAVVNVGLSLAYEGTLQQKINDALNTGTDPSTTNINLVPTAIGGAIGVGLWIWMAFANRAGHNWARITGTVFFGISCLSVIGGLIVSAEVDKWLAGFAVVSALTSVAEWILGLLTVILLWNKQSGEYFSPQTGYPVPYGYPGAPMAPYTYPVMPQQMQPQNGAPQQPTDPWATPNG